MNEIESDASKKIQVELLWKKTEKMEDLLKEELKSFRCVMIDDPIQTMDELNISSFVEVLRNDFSEYQFIISTHEDNFSDYIRYKYEKYKLSNQYISIQDIDCSEENSQNA